MKMVNFTWTASENIKKDEIDFVFLVFVFLLNLILHVSFQAFSSLAEAAFEANISEEDEEPETYELSARYKDIVGNLLEATNRYLNCNCTYLIQD